MFYSINIYTPVSSSRYINAHTQSFAFVPIVLMLSGLLKECTRVICVL